MKKILVVLLLILGFLLTVGYIQRSQLRVQSKAVTPSISFIAVYQRVLVDQTTPDYDKINIEKKKTALDLLHQTTKTVTKGEGQNAFVTAIDGHTADSTKKEFWAFYVNGKQAAVGAGSYILQPNDKIEWKIETY